VKAGREKFVRKSLAKFINELKLCGEGFSQSGCEEEVFLVSLYFPIY